MSTIDQTELNKILKEIIIELEKNIREMERQFNQNIKN